MSSTSQADNVFLSYDANAFHPSQIDLWTKRCIYVMYVYMGMTTALFNVSYTNTETIPKCRYNNTEVIVQVYWY